MTILLAYCLVSMPDTFRMYWHIFCCMTLFSLHKTLFNHLRQNLLMFCHFFLILFLRYYMREIKHKSACKYKTVTLAETLNLMAVFIFKTCSFISSFVCYIYSVLANILWKTFFSEFHLFKSSYFKQTSPSWYRDSGSRVNKTPFFLIRNKPKQI